MRTVVEDCSEAALKRAADLIRRGDICAFPTETVYGLGADALNPRAVMKIFAAKGRPGDNPLIVHIADINQLRPLISAAPGETALRLAAAFWPGALTMIFPRSDIIPDCVTANLDTVGIRMPAHPAARRLIALSGAPIAAPSANSSGRPSPTGAAHVFADLNGKIPMILDGGECEVGLESTVVELSGEFPRILRPGGVTAEDIARVAGGALIDDCVLRPLKDGEAPISPGTKYRHYAPRGRLTIIEGEPAAVARKIRDMYDSAPENSLILALTPRAPLYGNRRLIKLGADDNEMAARLFDALREADALGAENIFAEAVPRDGMGLAVMNRLARAAAFNIVKA